MGRRASAPQTFRTALALLAFATASAPAPRPLAAQDMVAFTGARLWDGTAAAPVDDAVVVVRGGRVATVGRAAEIEVPEGARVVDLSGLWVVPGLINAHGHVGSARGLESGPGVYGRELVLEQLALSARYGVTSVVSLGGDGPAGARVRDEQDHPDLQRARLWIAGPVLDPASPEEARHQVAEAGALGVDWIKFRVDDAMGTREKMSPEVYRAIVEAARAREIPVAAHVVALEDAKELVRAGADLLAHSVRDRPVDAELAALMRREGVCLVPTLAREVSVFAYGQPPDFFDDPFFLAEVDPGVVRALLDPERMERVRGSRSAAWAREALTVAQANARRLLDLGATLAFGTDSGPPGRFQGYFEHMEAGLLAEAGLSPREVLAAATGDAARCLGLEGSVGTLTPGAWADFLALDADPLEDVANLRALRSVWIAGNRVPASPPGSSGAPPPAQARR